MTLTLLLDNFVKAIKADEYFSSTKVIYAYPCKVKPTLLSENIIAVGLTDISLESTSIGNDGDFGKASIFADIFVPAKSGNAQMSEEFIRLCADAWELGVISVSANRVEFDSSLGAYVLKSVFTFSEHFDFGGESDE
ncbi:MAG: hypothetical protein LIO62_03880 [Clostridiales bacterium]|nr:hypothetical protein [Clostridiales bacterium]